jgi:lysophospholipid hydrolase
MVGGVSIGSFIGGLYSRYEDIWFTYWKAKEFSSRVTSIWRQLLDLTYPLTSWFTGHEFNRNVWKCFGHAEIEDTWLNYFCLTTNITHSRLEIHTSGYLWYVQFEVDLT